MISHLGLRLAASALTLATVLHPGTCHASPGAAPAAATVLPHISITTMGKGSPVVLIPGLSSPREVWAGIAPRIARDHQVILVQVNGFGGDAPGANLTAGMLDGVVADLHGYMTAHKLAGAAVIGHSMGGLLALMMAKAHPDDVARLMIVDALPYIGDIFVPGSTVAMLAPQAAAMKDRMAAQYGKPQDPAANAAVAAGLTATPAARAQVTEWVAHADPRVSGQALYEDMTTDLRPGMATIAAPITMVYPWSATLPKERADPLYRAAYAKAPHVTFVDVKDSAHFVMLDQPAAFAAAVDAFLAK